MAFESYFREAAAGVAKLVWRVHLGLPFGGKERSQIVGVSDVPFEKAMVVSYRVSIVTIALSLTIRPQFAPSNVSDA